jgi:arylformamidase
VGLVHRRAFMIASTTSVVMPDLAHAQTATANIMAWGTMTRAARDAAYNNSQAVSDSAQIVNRWVAASATFRSQRSKYLDVAYGPGDRNKWDLFPADNPAAPCLIFIHGGYWQMRSREDFSCFAEGVLARGWSAALPGLHISSGG